jgi:aspartate aminotransferase
MRVASRVRSLAESSTLAAAARARALAAEGRPVLSLTAGEPDFTTPANIVEAAIAGLRAGLTHYAPTAGTPDARAAIASKLRRENGLACEASGVTITVGAKHALHLAMECLVEPGDEVLLPTPAWVSYDPLIRLAGGTVVEVPGEASRGYLVTAEDLERAITPRTRVLVLNSPSNPTGTMHSPDSIREIAAMLAGHPEITVVSDEIYEKLVYPEIDPAASFLSIGSCPEVADRTITINGMSKAFAMTGWRIGYAAAAGEGTEAIRAMIRLQGQMTNGIPTFLMPAIVEALERSADAVESMRKAFARRAALVAQRLAAMPGLQAPTPTCAFYAFTDLTAILGRTSPGGRLIEDGDGFAAALLEEALVGVVSGRDFGGPGRTAARFSFACGDDHLVEAFDRLETFLDGLR